MRTKHTSGKELLEGRIVGGDCVMTGAVRVVVWKRKQRRLVRRREAREKV